MYTVQSIKLEISELQKALTSNRMQLRMNASNPTRLAELLHCRQEIYMSICHRQFLIMEILENELKFAKAS